MEEGDTKTAYSALSFTGAGPLGPWPYR